MGNPFTDPTPAPAPVDGLPRSMALSLPHKDQPLLTLGPTPEQLSGGSPKTPSAGTVIPYAEEGFTGQELAELPTTLPFEFATSGHPAFDVPESMRPWRNRPLVSKTANYDSAGVAMFKDASGKLWDHPVLQIQFGLSALAAYRTSQDPWYLTKAKLHAQRQIDRRVVLRGAWWFPYPFDWSHTVHTGLDFKAPWYSGMAQGEALSLFVQLAQMPEITAEERAVYLDAADNVFASFFVGDDAQPWFMLVDAEGYAWIQEYPVDAPGTSDFTFNGMIFALFGLWDYYRQTQNELALKLWDGGLTTIDHYFSRLRNPNWISYYCNTHRSPAALGYTYHHHHVNQFMQLAWLSGRFSFARQMDRLIDDYSSSLLTEAGGTVAFAAGTHTLYKFDTRSDGSYSQTRNDAQLATKKVTFTRATSAPASMRRRIKGCGVYYRISAGAYAGWWVGEYYPKAFLRGQWLTRSYLPHRTLTFPANVARTVYLYGTGGSGGSTKTVKFVADSNAPFDQRAYINGRAMLRISAGRLTGYWVWQGDVRTDGL
ncbi:D-glucuronyl C5-epimerase family protein [Streptomyces sp. NPDC051940]|uniref:D-glucuronyl C5-epimerase family protein n=1 Tax=Streptomyces sp. NPDC051940 TaxID=3155675 RepID=UPI00341DA7AC